MPTYIMRTYIITITLLNGAQQVLRGLYPDGFAAIADQLSNYPTALRISTRRAL